MLCAPGLELRSSIQRKYGRMYDLSIVRRQLAGRPIVAMNVMVPPHSYNCLPPVHRM